MHIAEQEPSFVGALLGLALGDAFGAPFEGGMLERALWRLICKTADGRFRWTDDTQMSLDRRDRWRNLGRPQRRFDATE